MKNRISAVALVAALTLAGCGSESGESGTEAGAEDKATAASTPLLGEAQTRVLAYFTHVFSGDARACEYESERYAAELNEQNGAADCTERIESVKEMLEDGQPFIDTSTSTVSVTDTDAGTTAEVTHELEGFGGTYRLVVKDGVWLLDGENDTRGDGSGTTGNDPVHVSEAEAEALAATFCQVKPGVTRDEVEGWMGKPGEEGTDDDGQTELNWYVNQDFYSVWINDEGTVASYSGSSPREGDPCAD